MVRLSCESEVGGFGAAFGQKGLPGVGLLEEPCRRQEGISWQWLGEGGRRQRNSPRLVRHWGTGAQWVGVAHRAESRHGRRGLNAALGVETSSQRRADCVRPRQEAVHVDRRWPGW